jgi:hypothetical protein
VPIGNRGADYPAGRRGRRRSADGHATRRPSPSRQLEAHDACSATTSPICKLSRATIPPRCRPSRKFREYVVPDDTKLQLSLTTPASSETSQVGDVAEATLDEPSASEMRWCCPEGLRSTGGRLQSHRRPQSEGACQVVTSTSTRLSCETNANPISAGISVEAPSTKTKDAAMIRHRRRCRRDHRRHSWRRKGRRHRGRHRAGGGTGVVLLPDGKPVEFARGLACALTLQKDVTVRVPVR